MIDEAKMANPSELSPRAAIALMSLKLRATVQEAIEAEAQADAVDAEAALWQLRSRLAPLIDDRRRALDEEVAAERERAAAQIADAHAEADRIVAAAVEVAAARVAAEEAAVRAAEEEAAARVAEEEAAARAAEEEAAARVAAEEAAARVAAEEAAARVAAQAAVAELQGVELAVPDLETAAPTMPPPDPTVAAVDELAVAETPLFDDLMVEWPPDPNEPSTPELLPAPVTMPMPRVGPQMPPPPAPTVADGDRLPLHVVIDAESFARAFAAALAPALENRQAPYQLPPQGWMPYQAPAPKKSFWSHAWHPDVLLSGLAMVIVIIVLVAWTG